MPDKAVTLLTCIQWLLQALGEGVMLLARNETGLHAVLTETLGDFSQTPYLKLTFTGRKLHLL
jgi:hypothetical protein